MIISLSILLNIKYRNIFDVNPERYVSRAIRIKVPCDPETEPQYVEFTGVVKYDGTVGSL